MRGSMLVCMHLVHAVDTYVDSVQTTPGIAGGITQQLLAELFAKGEKDTTSM